MAGTAQGRLLLLAATGGGLCAIVFFAVSFTAAPAGDLMSAPLLVGHARRKYETDGFVVIRRFIRTSTAEKLHDELKWNEMWGVSNVVKDQVSKLSAISKTIFLASTMHDSLALTIFGRRVAGWLRAMASSRTMFHVFDALYRKEPAENGGHWHRDYPLSRLVKNVDEMFNVWIPLNELAGNSSENGGLILASGSHKWPLSNGCTGLDHIGGEIVRSTWEGYGTCIQRLEAAAVTLPKLSPGDAVVFHPSLFHRTASSWERDAARIAVSVVAVSQRAEFQADQSRFECTVKPRVAFALEASGAGDGDLMHTFTNLVVPMGDPGSARNAQQLITAYMGAFKSASTINLLANVLLKCSAARVMGPPSYLPTTDIFST